MNWFKKQKAKKLINRGYKSYQEKDYELALSYFKQAKVLIPDSFVPYFNMGICHFDLGNFEKALALFNHALELEPRAENCIFNKIITLNNLGKKEEALENSFRLLEMNEMEEGYLSFHGYLLFDLKRFSEAIEVFEKLVALFSGDNLLNQTNYKIGLANCYTRMKDSQKAIEIYQGILIDDPKNITALNNLGFDRLTLGEYKKAIIDFDRCIVLQSDFSFAYNNRGFAFLKLGEMQKAIADINHSLKLDNKNSFAYKNKGLYFLAMNDKIKAKENFLKAKSLGFNDKYGDEVDVLLEELRE